MFLNIIKPKKNLSQQPHPFPAQNDLLVERGQPEVESRSSLGPDPALRGHDEAERGRPHQAKPLPRADSPFVASGRDKSPSGSVAAGSTGFPGTNRPFCPRRRREQAWPLHDGWASKLRQLRKTPGALEPWERGAE